MTTPEISMEKTSAGAAVSQDISGIGEHGGQVRPDHALFKLDVRIGPVFTVLTATSDSVQDPAVRR